MRTAFLIVWCGLWFAWSVIMLVRNNTVWKYRMKKINEDQFEFLYDVTYESMYWRFWKPCDSFYREWLLKQQADKATN